MKRSTLLFMVAMSFMVLTACSGGGSTSEHTDEVVATESEPTAEVEKVVKTDNMADKGIGPITSVVLNETVDQEMVKEGEKLYNQMCTACHKPDVKFIGPAQKGVLDRRSPEWIMNMILNPQEMLEKNATAKALLEEYNNVPMTDMGLTEKQARSIIEYFRTL